MSLTLILTEIGTTLMEEFIQRRSYVYYNVNPGTYETSATGYVGALIDQGNSKIPASQTVPTKQPILSYSKHTGRNFIQFDGERQMTSNINLNMDGSLVTAFVVYR
uniref:Uncharacterized protein n=1 Tax=Ciona savignyi TaxID=51511 RepID=H2ZCA9_CIOSA